MRKLIPDLESAICAGMSFLIVGALFWAISGDVYGQNKPDFTPTENQTLRLKVQQLTFSIAQEHYQQAVKAFNAEVKTIEKENNWPDNLQFDSNALTFRESPAPPKPPAPTPSPAATPKPPEKPAPPASAPAK